MSKWIKLVALAALGVFCTAADARPPPVDAGADAHSLHARAPSGSKDVIIQMFEWTWDSVASECTNFIGPAGYGFVQGKLSVSHPTSTFLTRGTRSEPAPGDYPGRPVVD